VGFSGVFTDMAQGALTQASGWAADYMVVIGLFLGLGAFGTVALVIRKFFSS